jgi:hypothetical protein
MSWRVGLVVVGLVAFGLLGADGPRSFATQSFIPAAIWSYPLVLLSLWQIARRISKRILENTPPEQRTDIPPQRSEAAIRAGRYRPTLIEGIVGLWFVLMLFSFALIMLPNHRKTLASAPTKPVEAPAPLSQQADRELSPEPSPVRLTAPEEAPHTIRGHDIQYTLTLPPNWTTKTGVEDFDTVSSYKSSYVGVIAEEAQVGTPEVIAALARDRLKSKATDLYWSQPRQVELDGRTWMEFTVKCQMENIPVGYEFCVYSGREGTFQVVGWTTQNLFDRDAQRLRTVMQTFRFPGPNRLNQTSQVDTGSLLKSRILEALQDSAVEGVRVLRVNLEPTNPSEANGVLRSGVLSIEAQDNSVTPGEGVNPFKVAVGRNLGLRRLLGTIEPIKLTSLSGVKTSAPDGTTYVLFTLQCKYPNDGTPLKSQVQPASQTAPDSPSESGTTASRVVLSSGATLSFSEPMQFQDEAPFRSSLLRTLDQRGWPAGKLLFVNDNVYRVSHVRRGYGNSEVARSTYCDENVRPLPEVQLRNGSWKGAEFCDGYTDPLTKRKVITETAYCLFLSDERQTVVVVGIMNEMKKLGLQRVKSLDEYSPDDKTKALFAAIELRKVTERLAAGFGIAL